MERWLAKVIALLLILILPFIFTLLPLKVSGIFAQKGAAGRKILSCLMCFGGGVFFATYLLHMAPESRSLIHMSVLVPLEIDYPLADLLMGAGFFLVLYIEKIVIKANKRRQKRKMRLRREQCMQFNKLAQHPTQYPVNVSQDHLKLPMNPDSRNTSSDQLLANYRCKVCQGECDCEGGTTNVAMANGATPNGDARKPDCPLAGTGECCNDPVEIRLQNTEEEGIHMVAVRESQGEEHSEEIDAHSTRSLVLLLALSLHRIFEGMTLGLQQSVVSVFSLLGAIMCHEVVIGFSLGLQFVKNKMSVKRTFLACFLVSLILPCGALFGMLVVEFGEPGRQLDIVNGVLQSLATGTFIYVTFFEILQEEISPHDTSIAKITSVLVGFLVMALITLVPENTDAVNHIVEGLFNSTQNSTVHFTTTTILP